MKFREHRGSLEDSLATTVYFEKFSHFKEYLVKLLELENEKSLRTLNIEHYGYDDRCKQNLHLVTFKGKPIGFIFEMWK